MAMKKLAGARAAALSRFLPGGNIPIKDIFRAVRTVKRDRLLAELAEIDAQRSAMDEVGAKPTPAQRRKLTVRRNAIVEDLERVERELARGFRP